MRKTIYWLAALLLLGLSACTIVPIAEIEQIKQSEAFDPATFVDGVWENQVIPTIVDRAEELPKVLVAMQADLAGAGASYATVSASGAFNFVVKGQGTIESVDTESRNGTAVVTVDGYNGPVKVIVQVGPLIRGDSIRDGVGFIQFGDFKDQTEFGQVSRELNKRVTENVLGSIDLATLAGKTVNFSGVFTVRTTNQTNIDLSEITIAPVVFEVGG
jgi:predicted lipoprotein